MPLSTNNKQSNLEWSEKYTDLTISSAENDDKIKTGISFENAQYNAKPSNISKKGVSSKDVNTSTNGDESFANDTSYDITPIYKMDINKNEQVKDNFFFDNVVVSDRINNSRAGSNNLKPIDVSKEKRSCYDGFLRDYLDNISFSSAFSETSVVYEVDEEVTAAIKIAREHLSVCDDNNI